MRNTITADQLIDILFQTDNRITANALDKQSPVSKWISNLFTTTNNTDTDHKNGFKGHIQNLKRRLTLEFNDAVNVEHEHPRSLRKALIELKTLGYSNKQLYDIKVDVLRFTLVHLDFDGEIKRLADKRHPYTLSAWCDKAFLGAASLEFDGYVKSGYRTMDEIDNAPAHNSIYSENDYDAVYPIFKESYTAKISRHPEYLAPEKPKGLALTLNG
jgi:hypothetical protein